MQSLIDVLKGAGYRCIGPQVREGAILYAEIDHVEQLPIGVHDQQLPGSYQLSTSDSPRNFAWANGPQALKPLLFAPRETLWRAERDGDGKMQFVATLPKTQPTAVIGVRSCDLAALALQDQHFLSNEYRDPYYQARRQNLFTVAVNCSHPAATCFCASTGDGPVAESGYDLVMSELDDGYLLKAGSDAGRNIMNQLPLHKASDQHHYNAGRQHLHAAQIQQRSLPSRQLNETLFANLDHPRWDDVAQRCLSCSNCTMVCPTCFCHAENEAPQLDGNATEHLREWDSCFTQGHSYIHGTVIRAETKLRYRQWLTHKLGSWHEQYGRSGCVGCGRCISWCPAAIDLTEEANAICGEKHE
jgi:ferredoxin